MLTRLLICILLAISVLYAGTISQSKPKIEGKTVSVKVAYSLPEGETGTLVLYGRYNADFDTWAETVIAESPIVGSGTTELSGQFCKQTQHGFKCYNEDFIVRLEKK